MDEEASRTTFSLQCHMFCWRLISDLESIGSQAALDLDSCGSTYMRGHRTHLHGPADAGYGKLDCAPAGRHHSDHFGRTYCPHRGMGEKPSPSGEDFSGPIGPKTGLLPFCSKPRHGPINAFGDKGLFLGGCESWIHPAERKSRRSHRL